jgi:predicted Zn-dependent peptidase
MAVQAQSEGNFTEDPNLFFVMVVLNPGHTPEQGEAQVEAELDRLKTALVSGEELDKAKNQVLRDFILSRQSDQSRAEELGYAAVVLKDANLLDAELDRFLKVKPEDIQRVARKYFVPDNLTVVEVYASTGAGNQESCAELKGKLGRSSKALSGRAHTKNATPSVFARRMSPFRLRFGIDVDQ